jgi:putative ABC transport system substrate-binding protein
MRRRNFITLLAGAAAWPVAARGQQRERVRRIGVLWGGQSADDPETQTRTTAFVQGLAQLGWTVGRNARIDYRYASGDRNVIRKYAEELVALAPDIIVSDGGGSVGPLQQVTRTVPIVFVGVVDPVAGGFVASLAHPAAMPPGSAGSNTAWPENGRNCSNRSRRP